MQSPGTKNDKGKLRMSLFPKGVLTGLLRVLEFGSRTYSDDNWQLVSQPRPRYYNAMMRHVELWWQGEKLDRDSGEHHLLHAMACAAFLVWFDAQEEKLPAAQLPEIRCSANIEADGHVTVYPPIFGKTLYPAQPITCDDRPMLNTSVCCPYCAGNPDHAYPAGCSPTPL